MILVKLSQAYNIAVVTLALICTCLLYQKV